MESLKDLSLFSEKRFWLIACVVITFIVVAPNINNDWVNWDDEKFVLNNELVDNISFENTKKIFLTLENNGGYTPIVVLSWSLDYSINGFNPHVFHATNVILHLVNVALVFLLIFLLFNRLELAVIVALLFGVHPMQLEAVAWITSRKDLLYGMFYLAGLITYLKFLKAEPDKRRKVYILCLLFFLGSLLSKGMAVTFPISLLILDFVNKRKDVRKMLQEKTPFFILSILIGLVAVAGQQKGGAVDEMQNISFLESFFVACYGLTVYVIKALVPYQLSSYHPYPYAPGQAIPAYIYSAVVPALAILVAVYYALKKNRSIAFGVLFFLTSIVLMLQFFPVGLAIVSERFSYIAYIGLFFLMAYGALKIADRFQLKHKTVYLFFGIYLIILASATYQRSDVWENSETLWSDVIKKYPDDFLSYCNRASYYVSNGEADKAIADFSSALTLNGQAFRTYNDRGNLYLQQGDFENAMIDFEKAVSLNPEFADAHINKGLVLMNVNQYDAAKANFDLAIKLESANPLAYYNRALLYLKINQPENALTDYSKAISLDENNFISLIGRADLYQRMGKTDLAKEDYEKCIEVNQEIAHSYFSLGNIYLNEQNLDKALDLFEQVVELDNRFAAAYINIGLVHLNRKNYPLALEALNHGLSIDPNNQMGYFNRGLVYNFMNDHPKAIADQTKCLFLDPNYAPAYYWRSLSYAKQHIREEALQDALKAKSLNYPVEDAYISSLGE